MDEVGIVVFTTIAMLSPNNSDVSSILHPIIDKEYLRAINISTAILEAINSEPYVEDSTVFCLLDVQDMGVLFNRMSIPVTDLLVN